MNIRIKKPLPANEEMNIKKDNPVIAAYTQRYLNTSMTFVYRQIKSVEDEFSPIVLTSNEINNIDIYPAEKIFSRPKTTLGRLYRFMKKQMGSYSILSGDQINYFKQVTKENQVKLIHAHFGPAGIEIIPVAKALKLPLIVTFHGYDASSLLKNSKYISDLQPVFRYAHIVAVSDYMATKLISAGADASRMSVIRYGISPEKFPFIKRDPVHIKYKENRTINFLQLSNFNEKKGHKYTVLAFNELIKKQSNCTLTLAGDGELRSEIEGLSASLGIRDKVFFPGNVKPEAVKTFMAEADVFLHHSLTASSGDQEGIPNVIIEAMATGLPVISTFHAGIPELIKDGYNGFLVEEKDIDSYTRKMIEIIKIENNFASLASNTVFQDFNLITQACKLKELYKSLMKL
ncbi:MAG: glycosyltransferase [Methanococcaceae archaeon]